MSTLLWLATAYWLLHLFATWRRAVDSRWALDADDYRDPPPDAPRVSICVPARNEAGVIGSCVRHVLAQDHTDFELILVDDDSSDGTADIARQAAAGDERLRVIEGHGPPPGWMGKAAALWRAQAVAEGEWLCFVDADVELHPRAVSVALGAARAEGADMLSWFGQFVTVSFWERVLMPFIGDLIVVSAPLDKVNNPQLDDCLANGQFILIRRDAYDAIGGHEANKDSVVDDVSMGRSVKFHATANAAERGARPGDRRLQYRLFHSLGLMNVRMYDSFGAVWRGFSKNFYAASKQQPLLMAGVLLYLGWMSVLPWIALPWIALSGGPGLHAALAAVLATLAYRHFTLPYSRVPLAYLLLHPLAALVTIGIVSDSTLQGLGLREAVAWKGRSVGR